MTPAGAPPARRALFPIVILLCAIVPYLRALEGGFVWTDHHFVQDNPALAQWETLPQLFVTDAWHIGGETRRIGYYRPTRNLTFLLDTKLFGTSPVGYHFTNLALHALCSLLVFGVVRGVWRDDLLAGASAVLFAVHPVHVEVVAWITGRTDSVATLGYLFALLAWLRAYEAERTRRGWWVAGCLGAIWALLGKEIAVTLPAGLALCLWFRNAPRDRDWRALAVRCAPALVLAAVYMVVRGQVLSAVANHPLWGNGLGPHLLTALSLPLSYARLLVAGGPLIAIYAEHVYDSPLAPAVLGGALVVALVLFAATRVRRAPRVAFGAAWLGLTYLPVAQLVPFKVLLAERFLYLPSVGYCVILAAGLTALYRVRREAGAVAVAALLLFYAGRTWRHVPVWADDFTLLEDSLRKAPDATEAILELARAHYEAGHVEDALDLYRKATEMRPRYYLAWYNLGLLEQEQGDTADALHAMRQAVQCNPDHVDSWRALGLLAFAEHDFHTAETAFSEVVSRHASGKAYMWYGRALARNEKWYNAAEILSAAAAGQWSTPMLMAEAGNALVEIGKQKEAKEFFRAARERAPDLEAQLLSESRRAKREEDLVSARYYATVAIRFAPDSFVAVGNYIQLVEPVSPIAARDVMAGYVAAHPDDYLAQVGYVRFLLRNDMSQLAKDAVESFVHRNKQAPELWLVWAEERMAAGDPAGATRAAMHASDMVPAIPAYALMAGEAALAADDAETAIRAFERAQKAIPTHPRVERGLAQAYFMAGRTADARRMVQQGLERAPDDPTLLGLQDALNRQGS